MCILKEDAKLPRGGDQTTIQVKEFPDEWERTPPVMCSHEARAGGTGGTAGKLFWLTRDQSIPERFAALKHQEAAVAKR